MKPGSFFSLDGVPWLIHGLKVALLLSLITLVGCKSEPESPGEIKQQAFADLRADIELVIVDETRMKKAQTLVDELEDRLLQIEQSRITRREKLNALNAEYDTPRQAFVDLYDKIREEATQNQVEVSRMQRELLKVTTGEEWSQLGKLHRHALDATLALMQAT